MLRTVEVLARVKVHLVPIWNHDSIACVCDYAMVIHVVTPVGKPLVKLIRGVKGTSFTEAGRVVEGGCALSEAIVR